MGHVTVSAFIQKEAFLASWPTCLAWYGLKAVESRLKAVTTVSRVPDLVGADLFRFLVCAKLA